MHSRLNERRSVRSQLVKATLGNRSQRHVRFVEPPYSSTRPYGFIFCNRSRPFARPASQFCRENIALRNEPFKPYADRRIERRAVSVHFVTIRIDRARTYSRQNCVKRCFPKINILRVAVQCSFYAHTETRNARREWRFYERNGIIAMAFFLSTYIYVHTQTFRIPNARAFCFSTG